MITVTITPEIYRDLADKIVNNLSLSGVCDEVFYWEMAGFSIEAPIKCIIYRKHESEERNPIIDVGFLWAELRTITEAGEALNDFKIDTLREYIIG